MHPVIVLSDARTLKSGLTPLSVAAKSTYVKVHLEDDRTLPLCVEGAGEGDSADFRPSPLIFVVVHSDAVATIKVRDKKDGAQFYGQVASILSDESATQSCSGSD